MNENKTIVTTLDFKMVGEKELVGLFQNLNQLFDTEKLKTEANKVHATLLGVFNNIEKDLMSGTAVDVNKTGVMKGLNQLSALLDKIQVKAVGSSATKVLAELDGKIAAAQARVDKAMESVKKIDKEIEAKKAELSKRMQDGSFGQVFTEDLQETDNVISKLAEVRKEMEELDAAGKDITGLKKQEESLIRLAQAIQDVNKDLIKLGRSKGGHASQKTQGENALKDLTSQKKDTIAANPKEVSDQAKAYQRLYDVLELFRTLNLDQSVRDEREEREKSNEETKKATEENEKLNRSVKKGEKTWGRKVVEMFAYQNVLRQVKQIWTTSIQVITELDRAMVEAAIVTNMTTKETWKLLGSYQELADVVGRSTSEIASLNAFFLQQGLTVKNAMEMTEVAAKSAAIAGISLQESANYLTSAINGFGLAASAAEEVADKFAAVGAATAADFEELAIAMSKVAPVAQSAGVGIDFMMGVLAKGIHTTREAPENIGTAFKTIFARMSELTDMGKAMEDGMSLNRVEKALESVGISLRDQMGQFRDLEDVLYEVGFAWKDLDSLQQNYLATALAGTRQQPRLMAILNDFEETVDFINISKDSAQAMEFQHMEYMTGMEAASQSVKNAWEKVVTSFVDSEVVISALKAISSIVNGLAKIIDFLNNGVVRFILVTGLAGVAVILLKKGLATLGRQIKLAAIDTTLMTAAEVNAALATMTLTGAMKTLAASINTALGPIGWIVMALTAVVVIGKALYDTFKDTTMSVEEANKAIYESEQRNKGLDSTISRFEELQKKINKTNEELEEMIELQNQLEAFDGADGEQINFISEDQYGNRTVDQEKVRENRLEEESIQANARKDIQRNIEKENKKLLEYNDSLKLINSSIERMENSKSDGDFISESALEGEKEQLAYYEELAFKEIKKMEEKFGKEFKKIGRKAGEDFGKGLLKDGRITQGQVDEYEKAVGRVMGSVNFSNFLTDDGKADTKLAIKMGAQIGNIVGKAFESANNSEKMNLGLEEGLSAQLKAYQDMIKELDTLGLSPSEMNEIKVHLGFEFGNEQALEVLKDKNIDMSVVATFIDKGGKLEQLHQVLTSLGQMENEDVNNETWKEQEIRRKTIKDEIKGLDDNDAEQDQRIVDEKWRKGWFGKLPTKKQVEEDVHLTKTKNDIKREDLQKELDKMLTQEQKALSKISDESIANLFSREDLEGSIEELRATLVEGGMDLISAGQYIESEITSQLGLKNAAQIADAGANIGTTMAKALKIGEEMAAGDFTGFLELAQEFSQDAVDLFLEKGDISGLVDEATENMIQDINDTRDKLKGDLLSEEAILAEIERMRADGKSQPEIDNYLKETENINKNTNDQLRALEIMEGSMDAINYKMAVYETLTKSAADNFSKANGFLSDMEGLIEAGFGEDHAMVGLLKGLEEQYRDQALADSFNNLANIQKELEEDRLNLIEKGFMDVDGNMIPKEEGKELQESYKQLLESAADAAKNVTGEVLRNIEINNKEYAKKIKKSNETYKNLIDSMNKMHKTRWDDVSYENKLIDLQKNIYDARNKLSSAQIGGTQKQMQDAQEELRRMHQERRKAIEDESIRRLEEDLEKQRKKAEDDLEAEKLDENKKLVKNIGDLNKTMIESNEIAKEEAKENKKDTDKPTTTRPPSGGGGKGHQISLEKTIT